MAVEPQTRDNRVPWRDVAVAWCNCKHVTLYGTALTLTATPGFSRSLVMRATANADDRCYLTICPIRRQERMLSFKMHSYGAALYDAEMPFQCVFSDADLKAPKTAVLALLRHIQQRMVQQLVVGGR